MKVRGSSVRLKYSGAVLVSKAWAELDRVAVSCDSSGSHLYLRLRILMYSFLVHFHYMYSACSILLYSLKEILLYGTLYARSV